MNLKLQHLQILKYILTHFLIIKKNNRLNFLCNSFRFSDPCLLNPSDNDSKISGQNTPDRRNNIPSDTEQNNKFFSVLMEQIQLLHETNTKICRDLHEAKGK